MEEDPLALWNSLKEIYDQERVVMLPETERECSHKVLGLEVRCGI
jgi:hypothetical protein